MRLYKRTVSVSLVVREIQLAIGSYKDDNSGVIDSSVSVFLDGVTKHLKWASEMQLPLSQVPMAAIYAFLQHDDTHLDVLLAWIDRPLPLAFFMDKFDKKDNPYQFGRIEKRNHPPSGARIDRCYDRILYRFSEGSLDLDERGVVDYALFLCRFPPENPGQKRRSDILFTILNGFGGTYSVSVMTALLSPFDRGRAAVLTDWIQSPDFLRGERLDDLIRLFFAYAAEQPQLYPVSRLLICAILKDSRQYKKLGLIFDDWNRDRPEKGYSLVQDFLGYCTLIDDRDSQCKIFRHLVCVAVSSESARQFFNAGPFLKGIKNPSTLALCFKSVFGFMVKPSLMFSPFLQLLPRFLWGPDETKRYHKLFFYRLIDAPSPDVLRNPMPVCDRLIGWVQLLQSIYKKTEGPIYHKMIDALIQNRHAASGTEDQFAMVYQHLEEIASDSRADIVKPNVGTDTQHPFDWECVCC